MKQTKEFDCVEMMHQGQTKAKQRLEGKSQEELLVYFQRRAQELRDEQARRKAESLTPSSNT